jgi:halimadienyl-diphosphate synthase
MDLKAYWEKGEGISYCSESKMIDIDDMSIVYNILKLAGFNPDPSLIYQFEQEDYFATYSFERHPSISSNIHVLMALKEDSKVVDKILRWLRSCRRDGRYWVDKWNISPYYPTAHAIIAVADIDRELAGRAVEWILSTQRDDGGWGYFNISTAEETAYCLQALSVYDKLVVPIDRKALIRGREGLFSHINAMPPIWIGKCLFAPIKMVESALYSALIMTSRYIG